MQTAPALRSRRRVSKACPQRRRQRFGCHRSKRPDYQDETHDPEIDAVPQRLFPDSGGFWPASATDE